MALFDSDEDVRRKDSFVLRLLWPSAQASDATQLGRQGLVLCLAAALLTFVEAMVSDHPVLAFMGLAFYGLGALGVRQHSLLAASFIAFISVGNALLNLNMSDISTVVHLVLPALLLANLRVTYIARESALSMSKLDSSYVDRSSGMIDSVPRNLWPLAVYFFTALFAVGAFRVFGKTVVSFSPDQHRPVAAKDQSAKDRPVSIGQAGSQTSITVPLAQIQAKKQEIAIRIKDSCSWTSAPESAGFFLGMTIPEAQSLAASSEIPMKCKKSTPIPYGSVADMYAAMLVDDFTVNNVGRADTVCETTVLDNKILLYFFQSQSDAPATLAKAYNSLDSLKYKSHDDWESLKNIYRQKFGVEDQSSCKGSIISSEPSTIEWIFSEPFVDRSPDQPNLSLYFAVEDSDLIGRGSAFTRIRDQASQNQSRDDAKKDLEDKANKY